jgi:hypothetical protein
LFDDKVPDIKRTIGTPTKTQDTVARHWVDKAVMYEKGREPARDFRKKGCAIDLFLDTQKYGSLDRWTIEMELAALT